MSYDLWTNMLEDTIHLPDDMTKYIFMKRGTYGGRCYPQVNKFKSEMYEKVVDGSMTYQELLQSGDFIFNADVSSLYPASMSGNALVNVEYPVGKDRWSNSPVVEFHAGTIGFYEVNYITNKSLTVPILPSQKMFNGKKVGVQWTLHDGTGVYTDVDLRSALDAGYQLEFINKCLVWDKKSDKVFSKYVQTFYALKNKAEAEGNEVLRAACKLFLNGLYGKTLQKAIFNKTIIANNIQEFSTFVKDHTLVDWVMLSKNRLMLTGETKDSEKVKQITKPCQLGAFVLAYSRKFMLFFMKAIDPTLESIIFSYTDTDSLHISGASYKKLSALGYIKSKEHPELGFLSSDIKNEGIIMHEINISPKVYMYEYINNKNEVKIKGDAVMKGKGIPQNKKLKDPSSIREEDGITIHKTIKYEMYTEGSHVIEFDGLKKIHKSMTHKQKENGLTHFSIVNSHQTRTFNKNTWTGFDLVNGVWYPKGFSHINI